MTGILKKLLSSFSQKKDYNIPHFDHDEFLIYTKNKKNDLDLHIEDIQHLALRGSVADYGIYSRSHPKLFNLGLTSSDLYSTFHLYKNISHRLTSLRNVILFYSVSCPGYSLINTVEKYRAVAYKYYFDIPYQNSIFIDNRVEKKIIKKCKKMRSNDLPEIFWGYTKKTSFLTDISTERRAQTHLRENMRKPNQLDWLQKLIDLIQKENKHLYVVIPPSQSIYQKYIPPKEEVFQSLNQFKGSNLHIIDLYNDPSFLDSDFGDPDHPNEQGAKKLTTLIMNKIHT